LEDKLAEVASMKEELARASKEAELEEVDEGVSRTDTAWAFQIGPGLPPYQHSALIVCY
jgi:hypothetical protein